MHELSVVTSITETAHKETAKVQGVAVKEIFLEIGKLSGVEMASFHFVWPQCIKGTVLENAVLHIAEPEGKARCAECEQFFPIEKLYDSCPHCGSPFKEIVGGKELRIKKLIIN